MSGNKNTGTRKSRTRKVLSRIALALALLLCLAGGLLLALPSLLSSDWSRGRAQALLAESTGRPAQLRQLRFSWADGLRVQDVRLGEGQLDDARFLASLQDLHLNFELLPLLRGDLRLTLALRGLQLRVPQASPPAQPPKPLPDALREFFAALRNALAPLPLAQDAHLNIDLTDMTVRLEAAPDEKQAGAGALELRHMELHLAAQGLQSAPVTLQAALELAPLEANRADAPLNAQPVPLRLNASLSKIKDASGRVNPAQAELSASLDTPGLELDMAGSLVTTLKANLRAKPGQLLNTLRPLLPAPQPELDGSLALGLTLALAKSDQNTAGQLELTLVCKAEGLGLRGGPLGVKAAGPFTFSLTQQAAFDLQAETVRLPGSLTLAPGGNAHWTASVLGIAEGAPRVNLSLTDTRLALGGQLPALRAFLPQGLSLGQVEVSLQSLELASTLPGPGERPEISASVRGLACSADKIKRRAGGKSLSLEHALLRLDAASLSLPAAAPGRAEASLAAELRGLRQTGPQPLAVRAITLPPLALQIQNLRQDPAALYGLACTAALELQAQAEGIEAKGKIELPTLGAALNVQAELPAAKAVNIALKALDLNAPRLRLPQPGKKALELPLTLHASAPGITLSGPGLAPSFSELSFSLDLGKALRSAGQASLNGPNGRELRTRGALTLDAHDALVLATAAALAPPQAKATGSLNLDWNLDATLPAPAPHAAAAANAGVTKKLSQSLKELAFVRQAGAVLSLKGVSLDWPQKHAPGKTAQTLRLRGLSTPRPLRLTSRDGLAEASLAGSLAFGPMDALPGVGKLARPLRGLLSLNAAQQGGRSAQISQVLHLDGLNLDQNLTLTLDKLDTVLDRDQDRLAAVLELVDGSISFNMTTGLDALPASAAAKGIGGSGRLEAGAEARLSGGRSLWLSARLVSPGLNLHVGPELSAEAFTSSLRVSRRFRLSRGLLCPGAQAEAALPLSEQVFDLAPGLSPQRTAPSAEALGQLLRDDRTNVSGAATGVMTGGTVSLGRLKTRQGGLPLDLRDLELRLDDSGPVPGLRSFRAGLLGGDIMGSANVRKTSGQYSLNAELAFTGIDPSRLLPDKAPRDQGEQAEASGRLSLTLPLTADPQELLQRLSLRADFTKIGPRTLERMLYALDPQEQNETIVQQRRLMDIGYPRHLRVQAAYGNLSLSGAVDVKGFQLDLPPVDRLGIANLPLGAQLAKPLAAVPGLIKILDAASGTVICRDPAGPPGALRVVVPASQGASK